MYAQHRGATALRRLLLGRRHAPRWCCVVVVVLWVLVGHGVYLSRTQAQRCLPLPPHWGNTSSEKAGTPSFILLWSTDAESFTLRSRRCLESIFFHHPHAGVTVYSNQLPLDFFGEFRQLGFDVHVQRYNVTKLLSNTPAARWLEQISEWQRGPYFYSHVTDAVRLALLFRLGGIYLDTDVLVTRPIQLAASRRGRLVSNALLDGGRATRDRASAGPPPLRDALGVESYADPRTGEPVLNGALMAFGRGSRFLWNCLHEFGSEYKADRWSWNGPELLTRVQGRCAHSDGARVQVEPPERFYPLHWLGVERYAEGAHPERDRETWATIERSSYAVHVWNRKTAMLTFANGSLLHRLHNTWMVLPTREECT